MDPVRELQNKIRNLEQKLLKMEKTFESHKHSGSDGSQKINKAFQTNPGERIASGNIGIEGIPYNNELKLIEGAIVLGSDNGSTIQSKNSQLNLQHFVDAQSGIWSTFLLGLRAPLYSGKDGSVTGGGTTMVQSAFSWNTNELAGANVIVFDGDNVTFDCYEIASNTSSTITITGGTWSFSQSGATFFVSAPIYFGSAEYPWKRLYTSEGTAGGVRFGMGMTNAGQQDNGLLYMDATGDLYWRNKTGTATKLN